MNHHGHHGGRLGRQGFRVAAAIVTAILLLAGWETSEAHSSVAPAPASMSVAPLPASALSADSTQPAGRWTVALNPVVSTISPAQWQRILAVGAWHEGCPVGRHQLRNVTMTHWGFDGKLHRGVLVVNADVVASVKRIFARLLADHFPIRQMKAIEDYAGDDNASMRADNSSAYNCRRASQANAPATDSPHANGRAIDLNPMENPWTDPRCHCWSPSSKYAARTPGAGKITEGNPVWQAFHADGWIWQDIKGADYQHFDTGYPSRPYAGPPSSSRPRDGRRSGPRVRRDHSGA